VSTYRLLFEDGALTTTVFEDELNLIITQQKGSSSEITIRLESISSAEVIIYSSGLFDDVHRKEIVPKNIKFNEENSLGLGLLSAKNPTNIEIKITDNGRGMYRGGLQVAANDNMAFVPITYTVKPSFSNIAIWIVNGIALAVGALNATGYLLMRRENSRIAKELEIMSGMAQNEAELSDPEQLQARLQKISSDTELGGVVIKAQESTVAPYIARVISKLEQSRPQAAKREYTKLKTYMKQLQASPSTVTQSFRKQADNRSLQSPEEILSQRIRSPEVAFNIKKYATTEILEKNVVSGITGIAFGIIVGFIPLLEQDLINNLTEIGPSEVLFLLGLGVGIIYLTCSHETDSQIQIYF
jgi:hypothetical protein